jgi:uncharacterized membrane protein YfcA
LINALLIIAFLLVAAAYSAVGFGGGSTYNALLVLSGVDFRLIPLIALSCNILVVTGGVFHFHKSGQFEIKALLPFVALSIPMALLGGSLSVSETLFSGLLGVALLVTGIQMLWNPDPARSAVVKLNPWAVGLPLGAATGLLAGITGIGGGIFLAPCLHLIGWDRPRRIAAMASGFILVNSTAGLAGQLLKQDGQAAARDWLAAWPLFIAVVLGGQIGSRLAAGVLVLWVAVRLIRHWLVLLST